jgi:hypothetical protein
VEVCSQWTLLFLLIKILGLEVTQLQQGLLLICFISSVIPATLGRFHLHLYTIHDPLR